METWLQLVDMLEYNIKCKILTGTRRSTNSNQNHSIMEKKLIVGFTRYQCFINFCYDN